MLQDSEHPSQQQPLKAKKAANDIFNQVIQLFDSLSFEPVNQTGNSNSDVPQGGKSS